VTAVLDSWAVRRLLENAEPAASLVAELLDNERPLMSWTDLGEVHYASAARAARTTRWRPRATSAT
jgi:hypothetical protein